MNPKDVNKLYMAEGIQALIFPDTDQLLKKNIADSDFAIAAWGGPCGIDRKLHAKRIANIEVILSKVKLYRIAGGKYSPTASYPLHGRLWAYDMKPYPYFRKLK